MGRPAHLRVPRNILVSAESIESQEIPLVLGLLVCVVVRQGGRVRAWGHHAQKTAAQGATRGPGVLSVVWLSRHPPPSSQRRWPSSQGTLNWRRSSRPTKTRMLVSSAHPRFTLNVDL